MNVQTITVTSTHTIPENVKRLTLRSASSGKAEIERKETPLEKVSGLILKLEQCPHINAPLQEKVKQWKQEYKEVCNSKESLSLALGKLTGSVIHGAIREHKDDLLIQDQLLDLEDEVIKILEEIIPENETAEDFIAMCKILEAKELKFKRGIENLQKVQMMIQQNQASMMVATQSDLRKLYVSQQTSISGLGDLKRKESEKAVTAIAALQLTKKSAEENNNQNKEKESSLGNRLITLQSVQDQLVKQGIEILEGNI